MNVEKNSLKNSLSHQFRAVSHNRAPALHVTVFPVQGEFLQFHGITRHTSCPHCRTWVCPLGNQEDAQPHHHGSWISEPHSTARARRMPFGLYVKGGDVSSPTHPAHLDYSSFPNWRQKPEQSRCTIGAQQCTGYTHAVRNMRHRC